MNNRIRNTLLLGCLLAFGAFAPALARKAALLQPPGESAGNADPGAVLRDRAADPSDGAPSAAPAAAASFGRLSLRRDSLTMRDALQDTVTAGRRTAIVRAAERVAPAVVSVTVTVRESVQPRTLLESLFIPPGASRETQGLGSGSIIDARGLVLTNEHVVRGATQIYVTLRDGRRFEAEKAGADDVTDIALLRLKNVTGELPVAPLGTSRDLMVGEWAIAIGNPFGYLLSNAEPTVTAGVISGLNRNIISGSESEGGGYYLDMIQTDASINPGNSGGPLVNALGQVIGVNSSIISAAGGSIGLGFAIPIDRATRIAADLLRDGKVRRVWTGVEVADILPDSSGRPANVEITAVTPGSPGDVAGLRPGMTISRAGGRRIHTRFDWEAQLLDSRVGAAFDVTASADGRTRSYRVLPQDLPSLAAGRVQALDDFTLITVTPAIRAERKLRTERGALIVRLSDAARGIGLREGDVIIDINRSRVDTAEEAAALLARLRGSGVAVRMTVERDGQLGAISFNIRG
jgi:serine protease Do